MSFGQQNRSVDNVALFTLPTGSFPPIATEIFRFRPGLVTQIQSGSGFNFSSTNRWFALGNITQGQDFYGLRLQSFGRGLTFGYTSTNPNNPRIEWIGDGANTGNLEFRVGTSFGTPGTPGTNKLVASMLPNGTTFFGTTTDNPTTVGLLPSVLNVRNSEFVVSMTIANTFLTDRGVGLDVRQTDATDRNTGIRINTGTTTPAFTASNVGLSSNASFGSRAVGVDGNALSALNEQIGVRGTISGDGNFGAGVYGISPVNFNQFAGFFDGETFSTTGWGPSDRKLKENVKQERSALEKLAQLKPVTYDYKAEIAQLNLPKGIQHGFVAQELAAVFPELTKDISKPIFDKEGKLIENFDFKSVNYNGLISVLTAGINELNEKVIALEKALSEKDSKSSERKGLGASSENTKGFSMEQNIPNPFGDQTIIKYQLPEGTTTAEIIVFDLNGRLIKSYAINKNQSQQTIKASEIGSGIFIYSLVQNGQELMTKKMIVK